MSDPLNTEITEADRERWRKNDAIFDRILARCSEAEFAGLTCPACGIVIIVSVLTLVGSLFSMAAPATAPADDLYAGFVVQPVKLDVQHPYNLKLDERYSYDKATDTHDLWVLGTDKPHAPPPNKTEPRTEIRFEQTYTPDSGLHMMDCDMFITPGTHAAISQVFGTGPMCILIVKTNGTIIDLRTDAVIARDMNNKWFHWTIIHDPAATGPGAIKVMWMASSRMTKCRAKCKSRTILKSESIRGRTPSETKSR